MKNLNAKSKCVFITHVVNPHQFYFKFASDIASSKFSKFDFEIQLYGNDLYAKKVYENGYSPVENELVIFFNVIFNKWMRGRVISIDQEITFWCVDSGIFEKWTAPHVLPLPERFHEDMKLVHLGGLSLLPIEKTINVATLEVETHLSSEWDEKSITLFKGIINTSKTFTFTEEFELEDHKFGSLAIKSNKKGISEILLALNNAVNSHQYSDEDLWSYVQESRLKKRLYESITNGSSIQTNSDTLSMKTMRPLSTKPSSELSSIENLASNGDFDDSMSRQSSSDMSTIQELERKPSRSSLIRGINKYSEAMSEENRKETVSDYTAEMVKIESYGGSESLDPTSSPLAESRSPSSLRQDDSNSLDEECHLRLFSSQLSTNGKPKNVRLQPLPSTMAWIKSQLKSSNSSESSKSQSNESLASSIVNLNEVRGNRQTSSTKNAPAVSTVSRRLMLASLAEKESKIAQPNNILNNAVNVAQQRFGIPAGYAKNCLDSFGGLNKS